MMLDSGPASYRGKRRWRASATRGAMLKIISGGQTGIDHAALDAAISGNSFNFLSARNRLVQADIQATGQHVR